jgi:hypothetical protein
VKQCILAGLAAVVIAGGLIAPAPPASAGCVYGGTASISRCDGPVQPDGTWQRCVVFSYMTGGGSGSRDGYSAPGHRCDVSRGPS